MPGQTATPPTEEFDEETLIGLGRLAISLSRNKDTGRPFRKLVKQVDPNRRFPSDEVDDLRDDLAAQRETDRLERERQAALDAQAAERRALTTRYSEEQIKEIEAVMQKYGIASYEAGAKVYASDLKPVDTPERTSLTTGATWEMPKHEGLFDDPISWSRNEAAKVIDEIRNGTFRPGA